MKTIRSLLIFTVALIGLASMFWIGSNYLYAFFHLKHHGTQVQALYVKSEKIFISRYVKGSSHHYYSYLEWTHPITKAKHTYKKTIKKEEYDFLITQPSRSIGTKLMVDLIHPSNKKILLASEVSGDDVSHNTYIAWLFTAMPLLFLLSLIINTIKSTKYKT